MARVLLSAVVATCFIAAAFATVSYPSQFVRVYQYPSGDYNCALTSQRNITATVYAVGWCNVYTDSFFANYSTMWTVTTVNGTQWLNQWKWNAASCGDVANATLQNQYANNACDGFRNQYYLADGSAVNALGTAQYFDSNCATVQSGPTWFDIDYYNGCQFVLLASISYEKHKATNGDITLAMSEYLLQDTCTGTPTNTAFYTDSYCYDGTEYFFGGTDCGGAMCNSAGRNMVTPLMAIGLIVASFFAAKW